MILTERTVVPAARLTMYSIRTMTGPTPYIHFPGTARDDVRVTDDVLADQVHYYRRRAGEYDVTAYGDVATGAVHRRARR